MQALQARCRTNRNRRHIRSALKGIFGRIARDSQKGCSADNRQRQKTGNAQKHDTHRHNSPGGVPPPALPVTPDKRAVPFRESTLARMH